MHVIIAMDKLKGTATAATACAAISRGLQSVDATITTHELPLADGGDGTLDALIHGGFDATTIEVPNAAGTLAEARIAHSGTHFLIEVAEICGLGGDTPSSHDAEVADSAGVGLAIRHALDAGATEISVGLGGSATSDGGSGMLRALGVVFLDSDGKPLAPGGTALANLESLDWSGLDPRLASCTLMGLSDVDSPLLGPTGAAYVFSPQKGADAETVARLEQAHARFAEIAGRTPAPSGFTDHTAAGAGAAGGLGWGLLLLGAAVVSGGQHIADAAHLDDALATADLVITGEGRLDTQSFAGKTPAIVAAAAQRHGVPVVAIVGQDDIGADATRLGISRVIALADIAPGTAHDPGLTVQTLERAAQQVAQHDTFTAH